MCVFGALFAVAVAMRSRLGANRVTCGTRLRAEIVTTYPRRVHDVVIVGGGTAGCVLASRLTENPDVSVLLIEAGPRSRKLAVQDPGCLLEALPHGRRLGRLDDAAAGARRPRGRVPARADARRLRRDERDDGAARARVPTTTAGRLPAAPGWSWDDVEPAFARSAEGAFPLAELPDRHVLAEAFVHAAQAAGIPFAADLNGEDNEGVGFVPVSQRRGRRFSVLERLPTRRRAGGPNLTVVTGRARHPRPHRGRTRVGVAYPPGRGRAGRRGALPREVVLCAGAIGTPHLLQLSGIGPRDALEAAGVEVVHEHPSVGANLIDHLANGLLVRTKGVETLASAESLPQSRPLGASRPRPAHLEPRRGGRLRPLTRRSSRRPTSSSSSRPVLFEEEGLKPPSEHGLTLAVVLLEPRSSGTVLLRSSDPRVLPAIDPRYLTDPGGEDEATLLRGLRLARRVLAQEPLASFVDAEILPGEDARSDDDAPRAHARAVADALPPGRNVPHGVGRRLGRGSSASRPRDRRAARRRRVRDPQAAARSHELADRDDRRARRRAMSPAAAA